MIRALIVDDESLVRKGLRLTVPWRDYGIEIVGEAATGERALEFMRERPVELLLTDITMPGMSGLELTKRLKGEYPAVKVVILTCHQDFDYAQEALRLGAIDYIVKTQFENMNLEAAMERIRDAVREGVRPAAEPSAPSKPGAEEGRQAVAKLLAGLGWIMDDDAFAELAEAVRERAASDAAGLERELAAAEERWRTALPMYPWEAEVSSACPDRTSAGALSWLAEKRESLRRWLRRSQYSEDVIQAVLKAIERIACRPPGSPEKQGEISRAVNLSKSYFSTSFRDVARMTFTQFQQHVSVYSARDLLMQTNYPVYMVAEKCGFSDQRYFSKLFKEQTGLLPTEYRQRFSERG